MYESSFMLMLASKGRGILLSIQTHRRLSSIATSSLLAIYDNGNPGINLDDHLFKACTKVEHAKCIHAVMLVSGRAKTSFFYGKLINTYAQLSSIQFLDIVFDNGPKTDVFLWNTMVSAYVRCHRFQEAVDCFKKLILTSVLRPDFYTFPPVLKACRNLFDGQKVHCCILKLGFEWDVFVVASLLHMYSRFGVVEGSRILFNNMPFRDSGSWNAMISGYCLNGNVADALDLANDMRLEGVKMDAITVASTLPACAQLNDFIGGKLIHLYVIKHGLEFSLFVSNALIDMYSKLYRLGDARRVFEQMEVRDVISWNSIIAAYEQNNEPINGRVLFENMQKVGIQPDVFTLVSLASIVSQLNDDKNARSLHGFILRRGLFKEAVITGNAVVDMYAKMGIIEYARCVFEELPVKDVVTWNSLITGYAQNGFANEASAIYSMMKGSNDIVPSQGTWVSILPAYSQLGALQQGMSIHAQVIKDSLCSDIYVGTCLVDLYGKCGRLDDALSLFYEVPRQSSVPWNAIIACLGVHGHGEKALKLFNEMRAERVKPDQVTFVSLLSACSHSGMVKDGEWCFYMMQEEYGIKPISKHYGCMVDLYGRAGLLDLAFEFIKKMPMQPDALIWGALVGACRIHGNVELGKYASAHLFNAEPENVGYYVLLSNMYAKAGKWEGVSDVRSLARGMGLKKTPGWSSIEVDKKIDVFYTGNQSHPQCNHIYKELKELLCKMKARGYVPDFSFVLQDVEDDEKENILMSHSERLAIAYGIISTAPKSPLRIFKNLRVCGDCHTAIKLISGITDREIVVRDSNRFHHFRDGSCSCGDYW
ncbi:Pentatricopeptide repeat-containing protein At4g33990 [Linum perenne]